MDRIPSFSEFQSRDPSGVHAPLHPHELPLRSLQALRETTSWIDANFRKDCWLVSEAHGLLSMMPLRALDRIIAAPLSLESWSQLKHPAGGGASSYVLIREGLREGRPFGGKMFDGKGWIDAQIKAPNERVALLAGHVLGKRIVSDTSRQPAFDRRETQQCNFNDIVRRVQLQTLCLFGRQNAMDLILVESSLRAYVISSPEVYDEEQPVVLEEGELDVIVEFESTFKLLLHGNQVLHPVLLSSSLPLASRLSSAYVPPTIACDYFASGWREAKHRVVLDYDPASAELRGVEGLLASVDAITTTDAESDRLRQVSEIRNRLERGLRVWVRRMLKARFGPRWAQKVRSGIPEKRREVLSAVDGAELLEKLFLRELAAVIDRNWESAFKAASAFSADIGMQKTAMMTFLDTLATYRPDAHAGSISDDDFASLVIAAQKVEKLLQEFDAL